MSQRFIGGKARRLARRNISRSAFWGVVVVSFFLYSTAFVGCFNGKGESNSSEAAAVSSPAVDQTVADVLRELRRSTMLNEKKNATICFLGVVGSAPQTSAAGLSAETRRQFESRSSFRILEKSAVENALKESGVRANNLFIPAERKKFIDALGEPVDYLLTGSLQKRKSDDSDDSAQKSNASTFQLELVDLSTNKKFAVAADL